MASTSAQTPSPTDSRGPDVIDQFAGITPHSALGQLRAERPEVARFAQSSYESLLEPDDPAEVTRYEREMIALRVAALTPEPTVAAWHRHRLRLLGGTDAAFAAIERFPDGPALSPREAAILRHTDLLTLRPGAAGSADIAELKAVGLGPRGIVTVSQLISFMSFEVRVLAGLRVLSEEART